MNLELVLNELSQLWNINLDISKGAIAFYDENNRRWIIEAPNQNTVLTLYTRLEIEGSSYTSTKLLQLNANREKLSSAFIAMKDEEVILATSIPINLLTGAIVDNIITNLKGIITDILSPPAQKFEPINPSMASIKFKQLQQGG